PHTSPTLNAVNRLDAQTHQPPIGFNAFRKLEPLVSKHRGAGLAQEVSDVISEAARCGVAIDGDMRTEGIQDSHKGTIEQTSRNGCSRNRLTIKDMRDAQMDPGACAIDIRCPAEPHP